MSWDFFTWGSIAVLIVGSPLVFAWFLGDVRGMLSRPQDREGEKD